MGLKEDLEVEVAGYFRSRWDERNGLVVPEAKDLRLGNDAVQLDATVLYADITASTQLVDTKAPAFAAEIYKGYLTCAARIVKAQGGAITAYDGDRIMAVFLELTRFSGQFSMLRLVVTSSSISIRTRSG